MKIKLVGGSHCTYQRQDLKPDLPAEVICETYLDACIYTVFMGSGQKIEYDAFVTKTGNIRVLEDEKKIMLEWQFVGTK